MTFHKFEIDMIELISSKYPMRFFQTTQMSKPFFEYLTSKLDDY
jgi:hypothetical protein